jgi:hypothetical protein
VGANVAEEVVEVEDEAVVVVDEKDHGPGLLSQDIFGRKTGLDRKISLVPRLAAVNHGRTE